MHPYQDYGLKRASPPTSFDRSVVQRPGNATDVRSGAGLSANLRMLGDAPTRQTNETIPVAFVCSSRTQTDKDRLKGIAPSKLVFASSDKTHYRAGHRGHMLDSDAMAYLASTESVNEHLKQEAGAGRGGATLLTYRPMGVCINHFGSGVSGSGSDPLDAFSAQVYNVAVEGVCTVEAEGGWADARVGDQLVLCLGDSGWEQEVARNVKVGGPCWVIGIVLDAGAEVPGALAVYGGNGTNRKLTVHLSISLHEREEEGAMEETDDWSQDWSIIELIGDIKEDPAFREHIGDGYQLVTVTDIADVIHRANTSAKKTDEPNVAADINNELYGALIRLQNDGVNSAQGAASLLRDAYRAAKARLKNADIAYRRGELRTLPVAEEEEEEEEEEAGGRINPSLIGNVIRSIRSQDSVFQKYAAEEVRVLAGRVDGATIGQLVRVFRAALAAAYTSTEVPTDIKQALQSLEGMSPVARVLELGKEHTGTITSLVELSERQLINHKNRLSLLEDINRKFDLQLSWDTPESYRPSVLEAARKIDSMMPDGTEDAQARQLASYMKQDANVVIDDVLELLRVMNGRDLSVKDGMIQFDSTKQPSARATKAPDAPKTTSIGAPQAAKSVPASAAAPPAQPAQVTAGASAAESAPAAPYVARPERGDRGPSRR